MERNGTRSGTTHWTTFLKTSNGFIYSNILSNIRINQKSWPFYCQRRQQPTLIYGISCSSHCVSCSYGLFGADVISLQMSWWHRSSHLRYSTSSFIYSDSTKHLRPFIERHLILKIGWQCLPAPSQSWHPTLWNPVLGTSSHAHTWKRTERPRQGVYGYRRELRYCPSWI